MYSSVDNTENYYNKIALEIKVYFLIILVLILENAFYSQKNFERRLSLYF